MHLLSVFVVLSTVLASIQGRILFPEEFVSFLSFVYSILPPIKVGHDSRFGAGFRVGPNADFQVLLELGPQSETQPLGVDSNSVRDIRDNTVNQEKITQFSKRYNKGNTKNDLLSGKNSTQEHNLNVTLQN